MRDRRIDFLRFMGLSMIVFAHVGPPGFLFQIRNFDVPLMVLISGMSFALSFAAGHPEPYLSYVWKRFKRLVIPVWIFLSLLFATMYLTGLPSPLPNPSTMVDSYLLIFGIGYVWIIRVFLLVALAAPFILKANIQAKNDVVYFLGLVAIYSIYEYSYALLSPQFDTTLGRFLENTIFYLLPLGVVFALGLRLAYIKRSNVLKLAIALLIIFSGLGLRYYLLSGKMVQTQQYKYPPGLYYLSYALGLSLILWLISDRLVAWVESSGVSKLVYFIAENSIWIYLWHIPFIELVALPFYGKFVIVYTAAVFITYIQVAGVTKYILPKISNIQWRKNVLQILTG